MGKKKLSTYLLGLLGERLADFNQDVRVCFLIRHDVNAGDPLDNTKQQTSPNYNKAA